MGQQLCCIDAKTADSLSVEDSLRPLLEQNYARIKEHCLSSGKLFEDPLFPASSSSLYYHLSPRVARQWMRPREICAQFGVEPEFFIGGGDAADLVQGELGNCWIVAAASSLADHPQMLDRVVPANQTFSHPDYAGIFRFNFYVYGGWMEVVVDDRLPTDHGRLIYVHSSTPNEFWGALLEKAYAKLLGCYQALVGGVCADAFTSFSGGVTETYRLKNDTPHNIGRILLNAIDIGSLVCTGIWGIDNLEMENGLVTGHAFSVTDVQQIEIMSDSRWITLVRVRNPWGNHIEWRGRWSDRSRAWAYVSEEAREKLHYRVQDDGEFWMDLNDFVRNFDQVDICHLTRDSAHNHSLRRWESGVAHGTWTKKKSAGGRLKYYDTFASNPQIEFQIGDGDLMGGMKERQFVSVVVELTQKRRRGRAPHNPLYIGFVLYQLHNDHLPPMPALFFQEQPRVGAVESYSNNYIITKRFIVPSGRYLLVPSTWEPGEEGGFLLRVWSQATISIGPQAITPSSAISYNYPTWDTKQDRIRRHQSEQAIDQHRNGKVNGAVEPLLAFDQSSTLDHNGHARMATMDNPKVFTRMSTQMSDVQNRSAFKLLKSYAGRDMTFNPEQLQRGLNSSYAKHKAYRLALDCCRSLISLVDSENSFRIYSDQFLILYSFLEMWTDNFRSHDKRKTGHLDIDQFSNALFELNLLPLRHTKAPIIDHSSPNRIKSAASQHMNGNDHHKKWLEPIQQRFCDKVTGRVSYSEFINCCSKLVMVDNLLDQNKSRYADGLYSFTAEQILMTLLKS